MLLCISKMSFELNDFWHITEIFGLRCVKSPVSPLRWCPIKLLKVLDKKPNHHCDILRCLRIWKNKRMPEYFLQYFFNFNWICEDNCNKSRYTRAVDKRWLYQTIKQTALHGRNTVNWETCQSIILYQHNISYMFIPLCQSVSFLAYLKSVFHMVVCNVALFVCYSLVHCLVCFFMTCLLLRDCTWNLTYLHHIDVSVCGK